MKSFKRVLVISFFGPIIFIHELLHIVFSWLVGSGYCGIEFSFNEKFDFWPEVGLRNHDEYHIPRYKRFIMSYSPLLSPLIVLFSSFFSYTFFFVLLYFVFSQILFSLITKHFLGLFISNVDIDYAKKSKTTSFNAEYYGF